MSGVAFLIVTLMLAQAAFLATLYFNNITLRRSGHRPRLAADANLPASPFALSDPVVKYNHGVSRLRRWCTCSASGCCARPFGRILIAVRENEARTKLLGYNTATLPLLGAGDFGHASPVLPALCTALLFAYVGSSFASLQYSTLPLLYTLLGGTGVTLGPLVGTAIMYYLIDISSGFTSSYMIIVGAALLIVTLWFPDGIAGNVAPKLWCSGGPHDAARTRTNLAAAMAASRR